VTVRPTIRSARDDDGPALVELIRSIFAEYDGVLFVRDEMPELEHIATSFADGGGAFWCAELDGRLVGCIGFALCEGGVELKKLYVAKEQRRAGLASRLTELVERAARERGARFVELWSDVKFDSAHRFYRQRGYRADGRSRALNDASDTYEFYFRKEL
jgi:putative acetyltransferase